jgi:predicted membrane protein
LGLSCAFARLIHTWAVGYFLEHGMAIAKRKVTIKGVSPILMHQYPMVPVESLEKKPKEEQAEISAYRCPDTKQLYIPGIAIQRAMIAGATFSKGKGRASLQKVVAACVMIDPERVLLGLSAFAIDARPVVIPSTGGRVIRYRARLDKWEATFSLEFDDQLLTEAQLKRVLDDTGSRVGLLDFRPERKGPFGRFIVTLFKDA